MQQLAEIVDGVVTEVNNREMIIHVPTFNCHNFIHRKYELCRVELIDGRRITPKQNGLIHALIGQIADFAGELPGQMKKIMKMKFKLECLQSLEAELFSLSDCDETTAGEFIDFLIDFMIEYGIASQYPLYEHCTDVGRYMYSCLMNKRCAVCGKKAQLHHTVRIGMGYDRDEVFQIDWPVMALCRVHHTECHTIAQEAFNERYHLEPVKLTKEIGKVYGLSKKNLQRGDESDGDDLH